MFSLLFSSWSRCCCCLSSKKSSNNIKDRGPSGGGDAQQTIDLVLDLSDEDVLQEAPGLLLVAWHWGGGDQAAQEDREDGQLYHLDWLWRLLARVTG